MVTYFLRCKTCGDNHAAGTLTLTLTQLKTIVNAKRAVMNMELLKYEVCTVGTKTALTATQLSSLVGITF
jgi:hypothetical protein